jgi:hypothetical protein
MMKRRDGQVQVDDMLSAYLDGELSPRERAHLEGLLASDAELRQRLEALRRTVALMQELPRVPAPRNFLLTAAMVAPPEARRRPRRLWLAPALTFASAVSGLLLLIVLLVGGGRGRLAGPAPVSPTAGYEVAMEEPELLAAPTHEEDMAARIEPEEAASSGPTVAPGSPSAGGGAPEEGQYPPTGTVQIPLAPFVGDGPEGMTETVEALAAAPEEEERAPVPATSTAMPGLAIWTEEEPSGKGWALVTAGLVLVTAGLATAAGLAWHVRRR